MIMHEVFTRRISYDIPSAESFIKECRSDNQLPNVIFTELIPYLDDPEVKDKIENLQKKYRGIDPTAIWIGIRGDDWSAGMECSTGYTQMYPPYQSKLTWDMNDLSNEQWKKVIGDLREGVKVSYSIGEDMDDD